MIEKRPKSYWSTLLYRRNFKIVRLCDEKRLLMMILWIKDEKMNKNVNKLKIVSCNYSAFSNLSVGSENLYM